MFLFYNFTLQQLSFYFEVIAVEKRTTNDSVRFFLLFKWKHFVRHLLGFEPQLVEPKYIASEVTS